MGLGLVALTALLAGCAATQEIRFTSEPNGATVLVEGRRAVTPAILSLPVRTEYQVTFLKDGYEPTSFSVTMRRPHCRAATAWLLIFEPIAIVDCFKRDEADEERDSVNVSLIPKPSS